MAIGEKKWGYDKPDKFSNYERLEREKLEQQVITSSPKRKLTGKHKEKITLNLNGFKGLLREVAKQEGKRYHTLATDFIIAGVKKLEKKYNKNS